MTCLTNKHWDYPRNYEKQWWIMAQTIVPSICCVLGLNSTPCPLALSQTLDPRWTSRKITSWGSPIWFANHTTTALFLQSPAYSEVVSSSSLGFLQSGTYHILHFFLSKASKLSCGSNFKNCDTWYRDARIFSVCQLLLERKNNVGRSRTRPGHN